MPALENTKIKLIGSRRDESIGVRWGGVGGQGSASASASTSNDKIILLSPPALQNDNQPTMNTREDPTRRGGARKRGEG